MNARPGQGSNKQLVPLVRQDYASQSRGLFEAQFSSLQKPSDLSSIQFQQSSGVGESRLEFSKFLLSSNKRLTHQPVTDSAHQSTLQLTRPSLKPSAQPGQQVAKTEADRLNSKPLTMITKSQAKRSAACSNVTRDSRQPKENKRQISESSQGSSSESSSDRQTSGKMIDIDTYIREQRKIIKRVKSGSRIPTGKNSRAPSIQYEIKEFARATYDEDSVDMFEKKAYRQSQPHVSNANVRDNFMKQFGSTGQVRSRNHSSTKEKLNGIVKGSNFDRFAQYRTQGDEPRQSESKDDEEIQKLRDRLELKRANRSAAYSTKNSSSGFGRIKRDHFEKSMTFEDALKHRTEHRQAPMGRGSDSHESLGSSNRGGIHTDQGKL